MEKDKPEYRPPPWLDAMERLAEAGKRSGENLAQIINRMNQKYPSLQQILKNEKPRVVKIIEGGNVTGISLTPYGPEVSYNNLIYKLQGMNYKIAFTGSSGSGKTTLVKFLSEKYNIPHISGSAGDVLQPVDQEAIKQAFSYYGDGHADVIQNSLNNPGFGVINQLLLQMRRQQIIETNDNFVTDRSPVDNMTYFVNQCGSGKAMTNRLSENFLMNCAVAFSKLTHVVYIKAVQPIPVEDNGSRIAINHYQKAIDAQFGLWLDEISKMVITLGKTLPSILTIDYWDLEQRKNVLSNWLEAVAAGSGN